MIRIAVFTTFFFIFSIPSFSQEGTGEISVSEGKSVWDAQCISCHNGKMTKSMTQLLKMHKKKNNFVKNAKKAAKSGFCSTTLNFEKAAEELYKK
jgi:hypothetical protein